MRKIIHIDMDCFYAAVEQRDTPRLVGLPVAVAWTGPRGVVLTANYEARAFGVRSAMSVRAALQRCPRLRLIPPRMEVYREVSKDIYAVLCRYSDVLEPLSLDEAYLDVTVPKQGPASGTLLAGRIKQDIRTKTGLTASAGVSYNKFLAKLASGMNKPDGLMVITPEEAEALLAVLPIEALHGVGPATTRRLHAQGIYTGADLRKQTLKALTTSFGKVGEHFYSIVRGVDDRSVEPDRPHRSISAETTFDADLTQIEHLVTELEPLAAQVAARLGSAVLQARVVILKVKYEDFRLLTRRRTLPYPIKDAVELQNEAEKLLRGLELEAGVRLLGVGVEGLLGMNEVVTQPSLFPR